jgi:hypothetical protein
MADWKEHFEWMCDMQVAHQWGRCLPKCAFCAANTDLIVVTAAQRERMIREEFGLTEREAE